MSFLAVSTIQHDDFPPAVVEKGAEFVLTPDMVDDVFGPESHISESMRICGAGEAYLILSPDAADKDAFRVEVLKELARLFRGDANFMAALRAGQVGVLTPDEAPELNFQPMVEYTLFRDGELLGGGGFTPEGFNEELYAELGNYWNQLASSIGMREFYAFWPKRRNAPQPI